MRWGVASTVPVGGLPSADVAVIDSVDPQETCAIDGMDLLKDFLADEMAWFWLYVADHK